MPRQKSDKQSYATDDPRQCKLCTTYVARKSDMPRHMKIHAKDKEEHMHRCPVPGCKFRNLQKSNVDTHIRNHSNIKSKLCPDCEFSTSDPGSLTRHRKRFHGYIPKSRKPRCKNPANITPAPPPDEVGPPPFTAVSESSTTGTTASASDSVPPMTAHSLTPETTPERGRSFPRSFLASPSPSPSRDSSRDSSRGSVGFSVAIFPVFIGHLPFVPHPAMHPLSRLLSGASGTKKSMSILDQLPENLFYWDKTTELLAPTGSPIPKILAPATGTCQLLEDLDDLDVHVPRLPPSVLSSKSLSGSDMIYKPSFGSYGNIMYKLGRLGLQNLDKSKSVAHLPNQQLMKKVDGPTRGLENAQWGLCAGVIPVAFKSVVLTAVARNVLLTYGALLAGGQAEVRHSAFRVDGNGSTFMASFGARASVRASLPRSQMYRDTAQDIARSKSDTRQSFKPTLALRHLYPPTAGQALYDQASMLSARQARTSSGLGNHLGTLQRMALLIHSLKILDILKRRLRPGLR